MEIQQRNRFPQLDPLTDEFPELTPYQYASDEPIANVDMDGLESWAPIGAKEATQTLSQITITAVKSAAKLAPQVLSTALKIGAKALQIGLTSLGDNTLVKNTIRDPKVPLWKEKKGGWRATSKYGEGEDGAVHSDYADAQPFSIDWIMDMFGMAYKAKPHPLKPDFSDPLTYPKALQKILKPNNSSRLPGSNETNTYDKNGIVDPADDGEPLKTWSGDTSSHPERLYNRPMYITDSAGKPTSVIIPVNKYKTDTIKFK